MTSNKNDTGHTPAPEPLRGRTSGSPTTPSRAGDAGTSAPRGIPSLGEEEIARYGRHMILPEVTLAGQLEIKKAGVLLVGAGGLGSPVALYLAAAGVGRLGIVDDDAVDLTNLQRQVMFGTSDVGKPKIDAAIARIRDLNPNVTVIPHRVRLTRENALDVVSGYDVVVDGSDNFPTRYLVNDACAVLGKPDVYGSVFRFEGQASVFGLEDGPCYRCLYPEPPPPALVPSCAEAGVLGVVPGIIGSIQAAETIKLIIGRGEVLKGRLLLFDALEMKFRELKVPKNPACPVCRPQRTTREFPDYEEFCRAGGASSAGSSATPEITPRELKACLDAGGDTFIIDVREPYENRICRLDSLLIPLAEIPSRLDDLDRSRDIVVYCRTGIRSAAAVAFLKGAGFERVWNLRGGILAWADEIDPTMPKY